MVNPIRYFPYDESVALVKGGSARAILAPTKMPGFYFANVGIASEGSDEYYTVTDPVTGESSYVGLKIPNGSTFWYQESVAGLSWVLYDSDIFGSNPVALLEFRSTPGYSVVFNGLDHWYIAETESGVNSVPITKWDVRIYTNPELVISSDYKFYLMYIACGKQVPEHESDLEFGLGLCTLHAATGLMSMQNMGAARGVSVTENGWYKRVFDKVQGNGSIKTDGLPWGSAWVNPAVNGGQGPVADPVQTNRKSFDIPISVLYESNDLPNMKFPIGFVQGINKLVFEDTNGDGIYENLVLGADSTSLIGGVITPPIVGYPIYQDKDHYFVDDLVFEVETDKSRANFVACGLLYTRPPIGNVKLPNGNSVTDDFIYDKFIQYYPNLNVPYINIEDTPYWVHNPDGSKKQYLLNDIGKNRVTKIINSDMIDGLYTLKTSHGTYYRVVLEDTDNDGIYDKIFNVQNHGGNGGYTTPPNTIVDKYDVVSGVQIVVPNKLELQDSILFFDINDGEYSNNTNNDFRALVYDKLTGEYSYRNIPRSRIVDTPPNTLPNKNPTGSSTGTGPTQTGSDTGMNLVNSITTSGKIGVTYIADSGYNRMYMLMQGQFSSPMRTLGTSGIGPNLIQTDQGPYWYGVLEDRDNDGFFETIINNPDQNGMGGNIETYPSELVGLYVLDSPPGIQVSQPNIISMLIPNFGEMKVSMHSIIGIADQYLAIMKTPKGYLVSEVPSTMFTTTPTV